VQQRRFVYILRSDSVPSRHYVGLASNVAERIRAHNAGESHHASKFRPWRLVIAIEFAEAEDAVKFERYLKSGSGRAFAKRHFG
jgi:predicted GIY-YIG superfamily endonuclease